MEFYCIFKFSVSGLLYRHGLAQSTQISKGNPNFSPENITLFSFCKSVFFMTPNDVYFSKPDDTPCRILTDLHSQSIEHYKKPRNPVITITGEISDGNTNSTQEIYRVVVTGNVRCLPTR